MIGFVQQPVFTSGRPRFVVTIPDVNFLAYLVGNKAINTNGDNLIQTSEAIAFNGTIDCSRKNVFNLTGIEAFTALTFLDCGHNKFNCDALKSKYGLD